MRSIAPYPRRRSTACVTGIHDERAVQAAFLHGHSARLLDFPFPEDEATTASLRPARAAPDLIRSIADRDARIGSFTRLFDPPLAGTQGLDGSVRLFDVPFAVKDLFDVAGHPTTAGAALRRDVPPAHTDATVVARLRAAGAVLVGTCNMDEFAYGFATVNAHYGTTRNPHDPDRLAGGSSGGSAAAVAAGLVPLALGSDTNGSIRVPAALCGVYGLRPTHGALPVEGVFPFVEALDVPGPLANSLDLLRTAYEVMADRTIRRIDVAGLRIATLSGWFARNVDPALAGGIDAVADELGATGTIPWPEAERARSAAYVLTAAEGGARHLADLETRPEAFDPAVRDRLLAGAAMPEASLTAAHRFAGWFAGAMAAFWDTVDVVLAPTVPCVAPRIDEGLIEVDGQMVSARAQLGLFTQPISLAGCPVLAAPLRRRGELPLGIQLIAAPGREDRLFAVAERLEAAGLIGVSPPEPR